MSVLAALQYLLLHCNSLVIYSFMLLVFHMQNSEMKLKSRITYIFLLNGCYIGYSIFPRILTKYKPSELRLIAVKKFHHEFKKEGKTVKQTLLLD